MIRDLVVGVLVAAVLIGAHSLWNVHKPALPAVLAPTSPAIAGTGTETKDCTKVEAFKPPAKKKLRLPEPIQQDEQASVLAAADVPRTDDPLIATALLHRDTGLGEIYFTPRPRPWLAFDKRWTAGVFYGVRDGAAEPVWLLFGHYDAFQVKFLHLGPLGLLDTDGRRFVGVGGWASGR